MKKLYIFWKEENKLGIEEYIERIIDNGKIEDMYKLSEILEDTMEILEHSDNKKYKKFQMEIYKMANGNELNRKMAEDIVAKMKPYRMRWSFDEVIQIQDQYGINNIRTEDMFIVMNSAYNDYRDIFGEDIETYIKFTIDFIEDEDAVEDKVFIYFTEIPNN